MIVTTIVELFALAILSTRMGNKKSPRKHTSNQTSPDLAEAAVRVNFSYPNPIDPNENVSLKSSPIGYKADRRFRRSIRAHFVGLSFHSSNRDSLEVDRRVSRQRKLYKCV